GLLDFRFVAKYVYTSIHFTIGFVTKFLFMASYEGGGMSTFSRCVLFCAVLFSIHVSGYAAANNTWSATANMATARYLHSATLLPNGKVLVAGGNDISGNALTSAELYDPVANTWTAAASMTTARGGYFIAILLNSGKVLAIGGGNASGPIAACELYDPGTNTWSPAGSLSGPRTGYAAGLLQNGKVIVAGGGNASMNLATAEIYDPVANTWSAAGTFSQAR